MLSGVPGLPVRPAPGGKQAMFRRLSAPLLRPHSSRPPQPNFATLGERRALSARWYFAWLAAFLGCPQLVRHAQAGSCRDNQLPIAVAGPDLTGEPGELLTFEALASQDPDGDVIAYNWSFNDGTSLSSQTGPSAEHTFAAPGEYRVRLWVMDDCGEISLGDELLVTIEENLDPCANTALPVPDAGPDRQVQPGEPIQFDGRNSYDPDGRIDLYGWNFGDGRRTAGKQVSYTYTQPGVYVVTLTVMDDCFVWSEAPDQAVITVGNPDPCADNNSPLSLPDGPASGEVDQLLSFDGSASYDLEDGGNLAGYAWDFGDGNTADGPQVTHAYSEPGAYTVTLTVTDACGALDSDSLTVQITAPDPCEGNSAPSAAADGPTEGDSGQVLSFNAAASSDPDNNIAEYAWHFGDGHTADGAQVSHAFAEPGNYTVTLTVTDTCDVSNSDSLALEITAPDPCANNSAPNAVATAPPSGDCDATISFSAADSSDPDDNISAYAWDFGDGATAGGQQAGHAYAEPGDYTVILTVTDSCGASDSDTLVIEIAAAEPCVPGGFTFYPDDPSVNVPVQFVACDPPDQVWGYLWTFGDGSSAMGRTIHHAYLAAGDYTVSLVVVYYNGQTPSTTQTVHVHQEPPMQLLDLLEGEMGTNFGMAVVGNAAWTADQFGHLVTVDITDPDNLLVLAEQTLAGWPWDIAASENVVAVAASSAGVYLFDPHAPATQTLLAHYDTYTGEESFRVYGVAVTDNLLYVVGAYYTGGGELRVLDISEPQTPTLIATSNEVGWPTRIVLSESCAYIGDASGPFVHAVNIQPSGTPYAYLDVLHTVPLRRKALDMALTGEVLAVVERENSTMLEAGTLAFFDVSIPTEIQFRSRVGNGWSAYRGISLSADTAYATHGTTVHKFAISDPENPAQHSALSLSGHAAGALQLHDNLLFTAFDDAILASVLP